MRYRSYRDFSFGLIEFLIAANLILFIATSIRPELFISTFGLQPAVFLEKPWTIVTNLFIHSPFPDIWHILGNMLTLYFFGSYLIQLVGEREFLIVYFIGGILGNVFYLVSVLYLGVGSPYSPAIGASGAIFAVAGALAVMRPQLRVFVFPIPVPVPLWAAVIGGFLIMSFFPGVAWQAHLGGLVFGLIAGYFFRGRERRFY